MSGGALAFMVLAWAGVLGLTGWCFARLLRTDPANEAAPPPGTSL